jgi:micrococcal nuclease
MTKRLYLALGLCGALACGTPPSSGTDPFDGKVVGIKDGDTFEVLVDGRSETVRLAHIDCPERGQPFGKAAKQVASDLCYGRAVHVEPAGKRDRYGRMIGVVLVDDTLNVNQALVKAGMAWHYVKYSGDTVYTLLEDAARAAHLGLWADSMAVAPWAWRKQRQK